MVRLNLRDAASIAGLGFGLVALILTLHKQSPTAVGEPERAQPTLASKEVVVRNRDVANSLSLLSRRLHVLEMRGDKESGDNTTSAEMNLLEEAGQHSNSSVPQYVSLETNEPGVSVEESVSGALVARSTNRAHAMQRFVVHATRHDGTSEKLTIIVPPIE